jgi:tetratricopeptide (TPR) repeat protein|tara:strand:+ start:192 stop:872 length:681 start_codon:yes stop_codon:yes gene_type:complete
MNQFDKEWLISQIQKDPGSVYFPILSHIYIKENELKLAAHICEKGLNIIPESIEGNFIMAQIQILNSSLHDAEKTLKFVVNRHPAHLNALKLLFGIQKDLKRSKNIIKSTVTSILKIKPDDDECIYWLQNLIKINPVLSDKKSISKENTKLNRESEIVKIPEEVIPISMRMATFTLAEVYKNQGYYSQALEVLKMVEHKGGNKRRLKNIRNEIDILIKNQINEEIY